MVLTPTERARFFKDISQTLKKHLSYRQGEVLKLLTGFSEHSEGYTYVYPEIARIFKTKEKDIREIELAAMEILQSPRPARQIERICKKYLESYDFAKIAGDKTGVLLQSTVVLGEKSVEGQEIEALAVPWFMIVKLIEKSPSAIYEIDPRKWEELIAGWYAAAGFDEVTLTSRSGDNGRDVIAVKKGIITVRIIEEVKAYKPGNLVIAKDVRALLGVLQADNGASKGIVTTTSEFAPKIQEDKFIKPFMPYRLELFNRDKLLTRLKEVADKRK